MMFPMFFCMIANKCYLAADNKAMKTFCRLGK